MNQINSQFNANTIRILTASSKIYGLRVDTVYTDCLRLASGIGAKKLANEYDESEDEDINNQTSAQNPESAGNNNGLTEQKSPKKKKKRVRKAISTVTKNKDTLNGKLDTNIPIDPLFAKWNSMPGDITSPNRMFSNILGTIFSNLSLSSEEQFLDCSECEPVVFSETEEYLDDDLVKLPLAMKINKMQVLRPNLSGYQITNRLSDDEDHE